MILFSLKRPEVNQKIMCKVGFWRHGRLHRTEIVETEYDGWNDTIDEPMVKINTNGKAYAQPIEWEPVA